MEHAPSSRPSISKLGAPPRTTANLFAALANRTPPRTGMPTAVEKPGAPHPATEHLPTAHPHDAEVELVREEGVVQQIVIRCKCGERIELDCVY